MRIFSAFVSAVALGLAPLPGFGQRILWQQVYGGSAYEELADAVVLPEGTVVAAGSSRSTDGDLEGRAGLDFDGWLLKTDPVGKLLWQKRYGGSGHDRFHSLASLPEGGWVMVGSTESLELTHGGRDVYVLVTDALGTVVWERAYGGSGNDEAMDVAVQPDGNLILAAETGSRDGDILLNRGGVDLWVLQLDPLGNVLRQRTFGGSGTDRGVGIVALPDGGALVLGSTDSPVTDLGSPKGGTDGFFLRLEDSGLPRWSRRIGGGDEDEPHALVSGPIGRVYAVGTTFSADGEATNNRGNGDVWAMGFDAREGELLWARTFGGEGHDGGNAIAVTSGYELLVAATSQSRKGQRTDWKGLFDGWLVKLSPQGQLIWQHSVGGLQSESFLGVALTRQGDALLLGTTRSTDKDLYLQRSQGGNDAWLLAVRDPVNAGTELPPLPTLISGYVTDARTGAPVAAEVRLIDRSNRLMGQVQTTSSSGLYQFATQTAAGLSLGVVAEGYLFASETLQLIPDEVGTEVRVDIALQPIFPGDRLVLNNLQFAPGSIELPPGSYSELDRVALFMVKNPTVRIFLDGHADSSDLELGQAQLARARALRVKSYLLTQGVNSVRMEVRDYGSRQPLFPGTDPEARALNRRVEVAIQPEEP